MIELEKTYLVKELPENLKECRSKEVLDIYIPEEKEHPNLRVRKSGEHYEITKKEPVVKGDASKQKETTIIITEDEFDDLNKMPGKRVRKIRYFYEYKEMVSEIDVFQDDLGGLVVADFEFDNEEEKDRFEMPDFCLADVTQENFIAGGMVCGKKYSDIEEDLNRFNYKKIIL